MGKLGYQERQQERSSSRMAEVSGITELQLLNAEVASLERTLKAVQAGEKTSTACSRVVNSIISHEDKDLFLVKEGGAAGENQYHNSAGGSGGGGDGCCVIL